MRCSYALSFDVAGLIALGVSGPLVLSFIVFLCSFVPVIGVFISTLPMAVAALGDYGMSKVQRNFVPNTQEKTDAKMSACNT